MGIEHRHERLLFEWLADVCAEFKMSYSTFFHTDAAYSKYKLLRHDTINLRNLQAVGAACMYYASIQNEVYPPTLEDCVRMTDGGATAQQVQKLLVDIFMCVSLTAEENLWYQIVRMTPKEDTRRSLARKAQADIVNRRPVDFTGSLPDNPQPSLTRAAQSLKWNAHTLHGLCTP